MNPETARAFFSGGEDFSDQYDEFLFQIKRKIIAQVPFRKLTDAHAKKIANLTEAITCLDKPRTEGHGAFVFPEFKGRVADDFRLFVASRNGLFQQMHTTDSGWVLIALLKSYGKLYRSYASRFKLEMEVQPNEVIVSKEPDAMQMLAAVKAFEGAGFAGYPDILQLRGDNVLLLEAKRLILYQQMESDVSGI